MNRWISCLIIAGFTVPSWGQNQPTNTKQTGVKSPGGAQAEQTHSSGTKGAVEGKPAPKQELAKDSKEPAPKQTPDPTPTSVTDLKATELPSGVKVWEIKAGEGVSPQPDAAVVCHYSGWVKGGKLFDTSIHRNRPSRFDLERVVPGFAQGISTMKVGGISQIEIPPELGYGKSGRPPQVPPDATLIYEVELVEIRQVPKSLKPADVTSLKPVTMTSGVRYWDIQVGSGESPKPKSVVAAHYSGWLPDGKLFYSTRRDGVPERFALDKVIKGLGLGIASMKVGGKRQLKIPSSLGYGKKGLGSHVPPSSDLLFDVELLEVHRVLPIPKQTNVDKIKPVELPTGLKYWDIKVGDGKSPDAVSIITAHYCGWLQDGTRIDNSFELGRPLRIKLGSLVKGWVQGLKTMKVGGKRRIEIPPELGFGESGRLPEIPRNATLIYEVELLDVEY